MTAKDQVGFSFACQVLEFHPEPRMKWVEVGEIEVARFGHAALSVGIQHLPCVSGESLNTERRLTVGSLLIKKKF